jgi:hypothetical protein
VEARRPDFFRGGEEPGDADGGAATGAPLSLDLPTACNEARGSLAEATRLELETPKGLLSILLVPILKDSQCDTAAERIKQANSSPRRLFRSIILGTGGNMDTVDDNDARDLRLFIMLILFESSFSEYLLLL